MSNIYDVNGNVLLADDTLIYTNPITGEGVADPCVVRDNGVFYLFSTDPRIKILKSTDLVNFEECTSAITDADYLTLCELTGNQTTYCWAPDVAKIGGLWLMYVTVVAGTTSTNCHMCVFSAPNPKGPWKYRGEITNASSLGLNDCIDADVVADSDGKLYMFIGASYGNYLIKLSDDGLSIDSTFEKVLIHPHTPSGSNATRLEGAFAYWHNGYYYLFMSAGMYTKTGGYHLVVSRSQTLQGPYVNKDGSSLVDAENTGSTILNGNSSYLSVGHNGDIFVDANNDYWIVYHGYKSSDTRRSLMLQKILWDENGWPYFEDSAPTSGGKGPKFW